MVHTTDHIYTFWSQLFKINHGKLITQPLGGRKDKAFATETVNSGSIRIWSKTIKVGIHYFSA